MSRLTLKRFSFGLRGAFTTLFTAVLIAALKHTGLSWAGLVAGILCALLILGVLLDVGLRTFTRSRRWLKYLDASQNRDGIPEALSYVVAIYLGASLTESPSSANLEILGLPAWLNPLAPWVGMPIASAICCLMICEFDIQTRALRRWWLPENIRDAIARGQENYKNQAAVIAKALVAFESAIPTLVETAEARGDHSIQLTFDARDERAVAFLLDYADLGWPTRSWGTYCDEKKFVHRACRVARRAGLRAEVFLSVRQQGFCLELSW